MPEGKKKRSRKKEKTLGEIVYGKSDEEEMSAGDKNFCGKG